jgi:hypothetical protein
MPGSSLVLRLHTPCQIIHSFFFTTLFFNYLLLLLNYQLSVYRQSSYHYPILKTYLLIPIWFLSYSYIWLQLLYIISFMTNSSWGLYVLCWFYSILSLSLRSGQNLYWQLYSFTHPVGCFSDDDLLVHGELDLLL